MRLEEIEQEYGEGVAVEWRSFLLRPEPEPRTLEQFQRYTKSWLRPAEMEPRAEFHVWDSDTAPPSHSVPAAVAGKAAASLGSDAFARYHRALLRAYFTENRTVSERSVLVEVASESGIDATEFDETLTDQGRVLEREVWSDYATAIERGIMAVPTTVVNDEYVIQGAVDTVQYRKVITALGG